MSCGVSMAGGSGVTCVVRLVAKEGPARALNWRGSTDRGEAGPTRMLRRRGAAPLPPGTRPASAAAHRCEGQATFPSTGGSPAGMSFFEAERVYPNEIAYDWYESLKGLDEHKEQLLLELELLLYPDRLEAWSKRHHGGKVLKLCARMRGRVPLILFEGDVGTGKTALAETVGDALARRNHPRNVHLLKINTQVRGTGLVGEMTDLIVQAFAQAETRARALGGDPVLLLLDEADALAASRDVQQMHHEDKAGLNTLLQRLDSLRPTRLPIAAMFVTNRPNSLDPAVRRRAALTLRFERPGDAVRAEILRSAVPELKLAASALERLVRLTGGAEENGKVPFTASDLTDRLLPAAFRAAYAADRPLTAEDLVSQAQEMTATPPSRPGPWRSVPVWASPVVSQAHLTPAGSPRAVRKRTPDGFRDTTGFDEGVVAGAQHGDEDLGFPHLPGMPVHHRHGLAGVIYEEPLARHIVLAQHRLQGALPAPVELTELAVAIAIGVGCPILLPEQPEGHPFVPQLLVDRRPLRHRASAGGFRRRRIE